MTAEPETKGAMTEDIGMEAAAALDAKMERHLVAQRAVADVVREWDERRAAADVTEVVYANTLFEVAKEEEAARLRIVEHQPRDQRESMLKLAYFAAYLFATRRSLKTEEMEAVIRSADSIA